MYLLFTEIGQLGRISIEFLIKNIKYFKEPWKLLWTCEVEIKTFNVVYYCNDNNNENKRKFFMKWNIDFK